MIEVRVPGQPQGKGRAKFGNGRTYTPAKTVAYEGLIALAAQQVMAGRERLSGAVELTVQAVFQMPKSWSKRRQSAALLMPEWHTAKPDGDNILKAVGDGLNGIAWNDDSQIARCSISKAYGPTPGLTIRIAPLELETRDAA